MEERRLRCLPWPPSNRAGLLSVHGLKSKSFIHILCKIVQCRHHLKLQGLETKTCAEHPSYQTTRMRSVDMTFRVVLSLCLFLPPPLGLSAPKVGRAVVPLSRPRVMSVQEWESEGCAHARVSLAGEGGRRNSYGWLPSHIKEGANVFVQS